MFCSVLISGSAKSRMKRESGESPEQSRCCKFRKSCLRLSTLCKATVF